jgi:AP-3 complex subunit beta
MSALNLNAISENASRLGMRIQETLSERSRDFHRRPTAAYFDAHDEKGKDLGRQLNSSSEREKLDALKCLVVVCISVAARENH